MGLRFIADSHLGKLARYLRLLGFDTLFDNHFQDEEIIKSAAQDERIVLSRDKGLLKDPRVLQGYWVRETEPKKQLQEVVDRFQLGRETLPFTRCMECNGKIFPVTFDKVKASLPSGDHKTFKNISQCGNCKRVYWEGSHHKKMEVFIKSLML